MKRNIFKTAVIALFILLCPVTVKAEILEEITSKEYATLLPEHIEGLLEQESMRFYVVDDMYKEMSINVAGLCDMNDRIIWLEKGYIDYAIYHEIGHFYDDYLSYTSDTKTFKEIVNSEKDVFLDKIRNNDYYTTDPAEYFAECFSQYCKDPVKLKTYLPQTYEFIENKIHEPICRRKDITSTLVGEDYIIDISSYLPLVTGVKRDTTEDPHALLYVSGTDVHVKGISKGKTLYTLYGPNNTYMTIRCEVTGKPTKQKKYNKFTDVISKAYGYSNLCLVNPHENEIDVLAQSAGDKDLKITFYDHNKKKVGSYKLTNETKDGDTYGFVSNLKISKKKLNKIEYYRIGES